MSEALATVTEAERALALVETPADAKELYDKLEVLSQYAKRYRLDHAKQNEIAEAKLRTARKGGALLAKTVTRAPNMSRPATSLPDGISRDMSSRWQALASIPEEAFEEHLSAVSASDEELTFAGALRFKRLGVHFSSDTDEWETPQDLFDELDAEFGFTLDVCASKVNKKCKRFFVAGALEKQWTGVCWMNPPYGGEIGAWVEKAHESVIAGSASTVVCLVPARTDTAWWWDYCRFGEVRFLRGRLKFGGGTTGAPFPSAVVVFGRPADVVWWER